jgi:osmoprotectant transport system substrate-binding protein
VKRVAKTGPTIVVGSANFTEDVTLADIYADWLQRNGYPVSKKLSIGSREVYFPALKRGEVDLVPDYAGSLLTFIDPKQPATTDPSTNAQKLATVLAPLKLTALNFSKAQDINGFVVTKATADKYHLVKISDLGKPAS